MITPLIEEKIAKLGERYPRRRSALLPALLLLQRENNGILSRDDVRKAAGILGLSPARAWGAATYYSMIRCGSEGMPAGSDNALRRVESALGIDSTDFSVSLPFESTAGILSAVGGSSGSAPGKDSNRHEKYGALGKARRMGTEAVIREVELSLLQGRGGAGYPAGRKWRFLPRDGRPVTLIANADEGEPGTFKDRLVMERAPHLLIEGIAIAAFALGAARVFIYLRGEYAPLVATLESAAGSAAGILKGLEITVHRGAGSYICGEETALIASLEGGRGEPRIRPPYPSGSGLYGAPTIVHNVETLASLPLVVEAGGEAYRSLSPRLFSVSGKVCRPGVFEFPRGTPLTTLLNAAGGVAGKLKAVIVGGLSSVILTAEEAEGLTLDDRSCLSRGTALGTGAVIVLNEDVDLPPLAWKTASFYAHESCGQCTPCRDGTFVLSRQLQRIDEGKGREGDLDRILGICRAMEPSSLCPAGRSFAASIAAMVSKFRGEFEEKIPFAADGGVP
jgi:NADH:ubiquinone oxidoreductase subunit F (NADH-binding)